MFERFTPDARGVVAAAQQEAIDLGHEHIGTEHLLLGVLAAPFGPAATVLAAVGVTYPEARAAVAAASAPSAPPPAITDDEALAAIGIDLAQVRQQTRAAFGAHALDSRRRPFTPRARRVLESSLREAALLGHFSLGPEHLLLAVAGDPDGLAAIVLGTLGADPDDVRTRITDLIAPQAAELSATGTRMMRLVRQVARLDGRERDEAFRVLEAMRTRAGESYQAAAAASRELQERLVTELRAALDDAEAAITP